VIIMCQSLIGNIVQRYVLSTTVTKHNIHSKSPGRYLHNRNLNTVQMTWS